MMTNRHGKVVLPKTNELVVTKLGLQTIARTSLHVSLGFSKGRNPD